MMKKKTRYAVLCLSIAFLICVSQLFTVILDGGVAMGATPTSASNTSASVQDEGVVRPEDLDEGLSLYSLDDIRGRRVTVRQPIMEVLDYNVPRQPAEVMDDVYEMLDFEDGEPMHELAKIDFASDKTLELGNKDHPRYPMKGLERSPKDENGNVTKQKYFSAFKKYMLLRQAYYFNTHVNEIIQKDELKKHPAADYIYGKIPVEAKAVKMRIVTDPIYRSPMTTGLYLAPGEVATVKIKGLKEGETLTLYTHHQDTMGYLGYDEDGRGFGKMEEYLGYWDKKIVEEAERAAELKVEPEFEKMNYGLHGQWVWQNQKVPCMGTTFSVLGTGEETTVEIGSMYGGPLYVKPTTDAVEMEITGAVLTPHFVLGVTTVKEFEEQLRKAPGLIATLDVENGQLIGPAEDMCNADDIEKLAYFWHSVFAIDISLNGRDYNYNMTMCYDMHVPAGEAVALNSNFCAQPPYWFPICMNYERLTTSGNWGTFHELGHVQAKTHGVNWGFCDGDGEVWNNTLILLIYSMLCNMDSRLTPVEHGEYVHPYTTVVRSQNITKTYTDKKDGQTVQIQDYSEINEGNGAHFDQLSMYATLLHSFGPQKFVDMFYTYKLNPKYCDNKRADFVYRIGLVDRVNILEWVNGNYFANIPDGAFTQSQLEFLKSLPTFYPVAYRWANGIDDNETARKYEVDGKHQTVFDLSGDNISSPKPVEIVKVTPAKLGQVDYDEETQKVTYTPPDQVAEYDSFDIIVRAYGGRQVTLNVRFKLLYHGVHTEVYDLGNGSALSTTRPSVAAAQNYVNGKKPTSTETGSVPGKGDFDHKNLEYFHTTFKFRATENGTHTFYLRADDASKVQFYKNNSKAEGTADGTLETTGDKQNFEEGRKWTTTLSKGDIVFVNAELVNWGGKGHLHIGLRAPGQEKAELKDIKDIPIANIVGPDVSDAELAQADAFKGWQPKFVDSIKNATIDYQCSNTGWNVLTAPDHESTNDKSHLVDGDEGTIYHSKYNGVVPQLPHVFVIDTGEDHLFNYFDVIRRTNGNDKLTSYKLYACTEKEYASADQSGTAEDRGWRQLFNGTSSNVNAARQRISFERTEVRYFKFIVTGNSGHTVIKELYAGIESKLNQTVKPSNYIKSKLAEEETEGFVENSANGKLSTKRTGATFEFEFLGSGFELYADTDPTYGKASVEVDGVRKDDIDLNDKPLFNKQVFFLDGLETTTHRVVVKTLNDSPFNISFINVKYGTPVAADEYPATTYGETTEARRFVREWKTYIKDYKDLTSIKFLTKEPDGYKDTYVRIDTYIRLYRMGTKIAFVYPGKILAPIECGSLFSGLENLTEIVFENFDTEDMRGTTGMFYGCSSLTTLDVSGFTTENVLSYGKMFGGCTSLESMDLRAFKLDENANIYRMFEDCTALDTIELPETIEHAKPVTKVRAVSNAEENVITCELPYVYQIAGTGKYISELVFNEEMAGQKLILHKNHTFEPSDMHARQAPTCTQTGKIAYKECSVCHCDFDYADETTLYRAADLIIPMTGHSYQYEIAGDPQEWEPPTCTKPGGICTHKCENCGEPCPDDDGIVEMPTLGHSYELNKADDHEKGYTIEFFTEEETERTEMVDDEGNVYFVQEEKTVTGKARVTYYLICEGIGDYGGDFSDESKWTKCHHLTEVVFEFECDTHTDATCTEAEMFFFNFSIDLDDFTQAMVAQDEQDQAEDGITGFVPITINDVYEGSEEVEGASEALGHVEEIIAAVPATCVDHGSKQGVRCAVCDAVLVAAEPTQPLGHEMKMQPKLEPTCTTAGHEAGEVCTRCGLEGTGVAHIEPLGHDFTIDIAEELPTCTKVGHTKGHKCARCGVVEGCNVVDDLGHEAEVVPGKAPTETESGLTDGLRCHRCGETLQEQEVIPALGVSDPGTKPPVSPVVWVLVVIGGVIVLAGVITAIAVSGKNKKKRRR